ncbi:hypothetical protein M8542_42010 [Amycolatopsis sp. OK19-0408]|uniref:Uncharacterized protein n=1 Tax=Amycolatopsis iheyensis TaxID=2945988 RepID=A0A9X2SQ83_9PSEU|nr:hypothetical protein [Amycolatopsis iheyensis]MCR6489413.1 hypothetical protein [Amycolatopsis iheyensis]
MTSVLAGASRKSALRLHKGWGIQRADLREQLGPALRALWGVGDDDPVDRVRAIVVLRLKAVLDEIGDRDLAFVIWTAYNLGSVPVTANLGERLGNLKLAGLSDRTCRRRIEVFHEHLERSLGRAHREFGDRELRAASRWLEHNSPPDDLPAVVPAPRGEVTELLRILSTPDAERAPLLVCRSIEVFLAGRGFAPASGDGRVLPVELGEWGAWLCVFTDAARLDAYRAVAGPRWRRTVEASGRDFVRDAYDRPEPTGVLINPSARRGSDAQTALPLPPIEIARLAGRG